ncbi:MAG TPA: hypothetical protein DHW36_17605 [Thalassospira sp.]|nr:hypothetical protein [Thalassospira sp.]
MSDYPDQRRRGWRGWRGWRGQRFVQLRDTHHVSIFETIQFWDNTVRKSIAKFAWQLVIP